MRASTHEALGMGPEVQYPVPLKKIDIHSHLKFLGYKKILPLIYFYLFSISAFFNLSFVVLIRTGRYRRE
jgi:hypothetical protein